MRGSRSNKEMCIRADKIDLKNWDVQLEKHLSRAWSRERELVQTRKEELEIESGKLDLRYLIAHGTYGTVYRANYDGQDVAVEDIGLGEDFLTTTAETAAVRDHSNRRWLFCTSLIIQTSLSYLLLQQHFVGASMGTSNLKIPSQNPMSDSRNSPPSRACCVVVVEYLPGETLKKYLTRNRRKKLAFKIVIRLAFDLSSGLSYLHSKKIVHRDVK
ncbi:Serine threonine-protein kinase [Orobanche minor]